ncbi:hypothetical protein JTB14_033437 [Gonioctena quinquepunctata]|nr:hypothetical protein JTB14_033437 [Gonioctena quinquepunctata]
MKTFTDWVKTVAVPYLKKLEGQKILIGDNLSSHIAPEAISPCQENNIQFVFLPSNSTHLTQPLDIAFFRQLKGAWRKMLTDWKQGPGMKELFIPKDLFPRLLNKLCRAIENNLEKNIKSGFRKAGIVPFDRSQVLSMLRKEQLPNNQDVTETIETSVTDLLCQMRYGDAPKARQTKKECKIAANRSVAV